jgi:hypothetical protein
MRTNTHTLELKASKADAFAFLSDIENLPKWATLFCKELKRDDQDRYKVVTPQGEIFFRIVSNPETGVVDMYGGPTEDQMAYWPARIVERPGNGSLFIFTAMQYPGVSDETFAAQCEGLQQEFAHIKAYTEVSA